MAFASTAYGQLRYIQEATPGVTPSVGTGVELRTTNPTSRAQVESIKSNEINKNRMVRSATNVDLTVDGGFDFELSAREYDPFIAGVLGGTWAHYGTGGLGDAFEATTTASTITADAPLTGASDFVALGTNRWFKLVPPAGASASVKAYFNDLWLKTHETTAPTSTVITLSPLTPLAGAGLMAVGVAGFKVSSSVVVNGNTIPSFTLEWHQTDIAQFLQYTGMRSNTMSLELSVGSILTGSFGFMGQGHAITQATTLPGGPNFTASQDGEVMNAVTDLGVIAVGGSNLLAGGTSFVRNLSLEINNNLRGQKALGVFGNAGVGIGEFAVSGTMEVYFQDEALYEQALEGENTTLAFGVADFTGAGYLVELDKIRWVNPAMNPGGKDSDMMVSLPFEAFYDSTVNRGIRITRAIAS
jgi:hypothetical protein